MRLSSSGPIGAGRILIVDDDADVRSVMALMLGGAGYDVTTVSNGFAALRWLEQQAHDLIISDLKMPGLDGLALYAEVMARWPGGRSRFLFVSGFADTAPYAGALKAVKAPVLFKPFSFDDLCQTVTRVLGAV
jgi:CheY-like chemotaxis protein